MDIDRVVAYIGQLLSQINVKLKAQKRKQILMINGSDDLVLNSENSDTYLKDNILVVMELSGRDPASLDKVPFGPRKNWNIHGITKDKFDNNGEYIKTEHIYRYDNMLSFYILNNLYFKLIEDVVYVHEILDYISTFVAKNIAERMFFYKSYSLTYESIKTSALNIKINKYFNQGIDVYCLAYYVRTQQIKSEVWDVISNLDLTISDKNIETS